MIFHKIVRMNDVAFFQKQISKLEIKNVNQTNLDILRFLYKSLQKEYRCEYVYKNNLTIELFKNYKTSETSILNEFRIGTSKADLVLLNGSIKVFEIKTELDGLGKLSKQLIDYQKIADEVYIVTDEKFIDKIKSTYQDSNIGIIVLNQKNKLIIIKNAISNYSLFDFETIFKTLRKQEYIDLVLDNFGYVPDVPNTKIYKTCFNLLKNIELVEFQKQVLRKLKLRTYSISNNLISNRTPKELKHICNTLNFNDQDYNNFYNFLSEKSICTNRI